LIKKRERRERQSIETIMREGPQMEMRGGEVLKKTPAMAMATVAMRMKMAQGLLASYF
jgi:hypothetical protein